MNESNQVFAFGEQLIRVLGTPNRPHFVAADVCKVLEIQNPASAVADFAANEVGIDQIYTNYSLGVTNVTDVQRSQEVLVVTETGLYRLIFRSDKPSARQFQDWVFSEVLPSIRKTGQYGSTPQAQLLWEAFALAKTGKVQSEVLQMLRVIGACPPGIQAGTGIQAGRTPFPDGVALDAVVAATDAARFWEAIEQMPRAKFLRGDPLGRPVIYLEPDGALAAVRAAVPELVSLSRPGLRQRLAQMPEWLDGQHKQRFTPGQTGGITAWAFAADETANPVLQRLCDEIKRLKSKGANENSRDL